LENRTTINNPVWILKICFIQGVDDEDDDVPVACGAAVINYT
jgi:hypothetical protein